MYKEKTIDLDAYESHNIILGTKEVKIDFLKRLFAIEWHTSNEEITERGGVFYTYAAAPHTFVYRRWLPGSAWFICDCGEVKRIPIESDGSFTFGTLKPNEL